ncbi:ankyrin repeat-containing protein [Ixodes scapularis]|uniref:Alpha-latrotoxin n=1 Tax=Ixodes scapularis TaxID=6945 RepID=B7PJ92_IXOSC|nr:ankyrin repeat-containing protein [Ixodes scapularis]|eukprot:XP_002407351.1 ankyrin repeat-containing protein [Ixodes scapularis]
MVRKKQLDHTKKRSRWKTDAEECSNWDSGASQTLDALQATVFGATSDRCKTAHLKELYKRSQLLAAAFCGHGEAVDVLLKAGHDPNVTARDGSTPLMLAINQGHRDIASKLIEQGADSCLVNQDGTSAMHMMVRKMDAVMFNDLWSCLEKSGRINISAVDKEGRTPLMCAAAEGQTAVVERLLQAGVRLLTEDQRRVSLLAPPNTPTRDQRSFFRDTLFRVFLSIRRQMEGGTELLLCHNVFEALIACGRRHACDPSITSPLFHLCACLLHDKADYSKYVHYDMAKAFIEAGGLDLTHEVSYKVGDPCDVLCRCSVLLPVLPAAELEDGLQWVRSHLEDLLPTFREFAYKKDIITYWADGEQVKTSVMWERFKENFCRIYLEAKGSPLDCVHEPAHGQDFDTNTAFPLHSVAQTTLSRGKGPALLPKKSGQKAQNKKIARPRAIQTMIQVTFTEESRFPKKARGTLTYPQKPIDVRAGSTEPANVFEAMSMAPKVTPTVLPLQGYANAVKSNIPNEVTSLHSPEVTGDCDQPRYKLTDLKTPYPWKETDISLLGCQKFAGCSSQPTLPHAFSGGFAIRHTKSDPELSSTGPNSSFPATIELFKELPPVKTSNAPDSSLPAGEIHTKLTDVRQTSFLTATKDEPLGRSVLTERLTESSNPRQSTDDVATSRSAVEQRAQECSSSYDQCKRKLPCQRLHALQEHLFGEIIRSLQMTKAEDRDAMTTVMTLMESMMNSINTLTPRHSKGNSDFRLYELLLRTDDEKDFAVVSDQQEGRKRPFIETNMDCYSAGEWFEGLASTAERTVVQEDPTSLSSVWVSENLRWESTFRELAHAPLCSLTLTNGVFYNEEKKHIPTMSR